MKKFTNRQIRYGLRRVRKKLLNGEIKAENFDMGKVWCGTCGCIGGHLGAELGLGQRERGEFVHQADAALRPLFFPDADADYDCSRRAAASAIKRYLDGERRVWSRGRRAMEEAR